MFKVDKYCTVTETKLMTRKKVEDGELTRSWNVVKGHFRSIFGLVFKARKLIKRDFERYWSSSEEKAWKNSFSASHSKCISYFQLKPAYCWNISLRRFLGRALLKLCSAKLHSNKMPSHCQFFRWTNLISWYPRSVFPLSTLATLLYSYHGCRVSFI